LAGHLHKLTPVDNGPLATGASKAPNLWLSQLSLCQFRNYESVRLDLAAKPILVVGQNGVGKTNLLEALSLLVPGRGMRRARAEHLARHSDEAAASARQNAKANVTMPWAVAALLQGDGAPCQIGTGVLADADQPRRVMRLNGETVTQSDIGALISASWLTPQMDGIFVDSPGARRRFIDRLVIAFDPAHIGRTNKYEKMLRERAVLLAEGRGDDYWFATLETRLAETAVAITAARLSLIADLNIEAEKGWFGFPGARLDLTGDIEKWLADMPALAVEDKLADAARHARLAGERAMPGPHASELGATHVQTGTPAVLASTGQQKALLIAVILAHARLQHRRLGRAPLMLLDDVAAHLDVERRLALFDAIGDLGAQSWFSGTDIDDFDGLRDQAQMIRITASGDDTKPPKVEVM
jgi:DNA replication and repair protein RecF